MADKDDLLGSEDKPKSSKIEQKIKTKNSKYSQRFLFTRYVFV